MIGEYATKCFMYVLKKLLLIRVKKKYITGFAKVI